MTTAGIGGGGYRSGLLERLFSKADLDQSQSVSAEELSGLLSGEDAPARASAILAKQDADGNNQLSLAELTGGNLAPETLSGLLTRQEYAAADHNGRKADDRKAVDAFFSSADTDGNGKLSKDEYDAERTLRMAQSLDAGETAPQHMFSVMRKAISDGEITKDEIMVGRNLLDIAKPMSLDDPNLDPEVVEILKKLQPTPGEGEAQKPAPVDTATTLGNAVRSAELTQTLIARLIRQLELALPAAPATDITA